MASYAGLTCDHPGGSRVECVDDGTTNAQQLCLVVYGHNDYRIMCLGCLRNTRAYDDARIFSIGEDMTAVAFDR